MLQKNSPSTGGHVRFSKDNSLPIDAHTIEDSLVQTNVGLEQIPSWRDALAIGLGKSDSQIESQRAWGRLCASMRELCPETEWISLATDQALDNSTEQITAIQVWFERLIASVDWPFPKQIIIQAEKDNWKMVFEKSTKLPFITPPTNLTVIPWRDKHSVGWKIQAINSYNVSKVGEA